MRTGGGRYQVVKLLLEEAELPEGGAEVFMESAAGAAAGERG